MNNQYDITFYCDIKIDWCSVFVPLVLVGFIRLSQTGSKSNPLSLFRTSINFDVTVKCDVILVVVLANSKNWSEPMRPAEDAVGTVKTFPVSEILEVVLKFKFQLIDLYHYVWIYIITFLICFTSFPTELIMWQTKI